MAFGDQAGDLVEGPSTNGLLGLGLVAGVSGAVTEVVSASVAGVPFGTVDESFMAEALVRDPEVEVCVSRMGTALVGAAALFKMAALVSFAGAVDGTDGPVVLSKGLRGFMSKMVDGIGEGGRVITFVRAAVVEGLFGGMAINWRGPVLGSA